MRPDAKARAVRAARPHGGVLRTCQLRAAGITPDMAERAVAVGAWQRPALGVYVPHPDPLTAWELCAVAATYARATYACTGLPVLHLLGLRWLPALDRAPVLVPERVRRPSSGRVQVSRVVDWTGLPTRTLAGLQLASTDRAVVDAGRGCASLRDVRGIVLGAVADRHASVDALRAAVGAGRRNGSALVRRAVLDAERGCASPPEAELVDALVGSGVPFLVNPEMRLNGVLLGCPDVWIVGTAVTGEVESVERHGELDDRTATYDRHEVFVAAGLEPVHLSVRRIRRPHSDAASYLLHRAATSTAPLPTGLVVTPRGPLLR